MQFTSWLENYLKKNYPSAQKAKFFLAWDEVIDPAFRNKAQVVRYEKEFMWVDVISNELLFELQLNQNKIISNYKKLFPTNTIKKIYFNYNPSLKVPNKFIPGNNYLQKTSKKKLAKQEKISYKNNNQPTKNTLKNKTRNLKDELLNLKVAWSLVQKNNKSPLGAPPAFEKKIKIALSEREEFKIALTLPQSKIHSFFLELRDEIQPFDLY